MAAPNSRETFREYCLRKLGKGIIKIEITDEQADDRIDEAIAVFNLYHYEGFFKTYLKHELTQEDIDNLYITVGDEIQDVVSMFDIGSRVRSSGNMFDAGYQFALNDVSGLRSGGTLTSYLLNQMHLENLHKMLGGATQIRFHSAGNKIHIDIMRSRLTVGMFLVFEVYMKCSPDTSPGLWNNVWLQNYATAKMKYQWGSNLTKMVGIRLPGDIQFNGETILHDADEEVKRLDEEVRDKLAPAAMDFYG